MEKEDGEEGMSNTSTISKSSLITVSLAIALMGMSYFYAVDSTTKGKDIELLRKEIDIINGRCISNEQYEQVLKRMKENEELFREMEKTCRHLETQLSRR